MADPASDDWAFGRGGFAKLYGDRLAQSSLLDRDVVTRWVFLFMLSQADEHGRFRCATVAGLARAAAVAPEQAEKAVADLEAADPASTSKDEDGRRIVRIPGGWRLVTFTKYREYRTPRQIAEAAKKKRQRDSRKAVLERRKSRRGDMSRDVPGTAIQMSDVRHQRAEERRTDCASPSASAVSKPSPSKLSNTGDANGARKETAWSREACDDWTARFNGTAPGGRIGKALAPLVNTHGWETVRAAWRAYLAQTDAEYASPQRFAQTFGRWSGTAAPATAKATGTDRMLAEAAAFVAAGRSK